MNPYQNKKKYREQAIMQMNSAELLLTLYDEILSRLKKAELALEDRNYEIFDDSLNRVVRIIRYLNQILDSQQEISMDLRRLYEFAIYDINLLKAGRHRRKAEIPALIEIFQNLRDGFAEAGKKFPNARPQESRFLV